MINRGNRIFKFIAEKLFILVVIFVAVFVVGLLVLTGAGKYLLGDLTGGLGMGNGSANHYAYGENVGWIDFNPQNGGVEVGDNGMVGSAYGENVGWIQLGDGNSSHPPYSNQSSTNWGVNNDGNGNLYGFAWGENVGWINFGAYPVSGRPYGVTIDSSGNFSGFAYGENIGWISFSGTGYGVTTSWRKTLTCNSSNWTFTLSPTECPSSGNQTKTWTQIGTCSGGITHPPSETVSCDYQTPTCTSFTYSDWSACDSSGTQTETVVSSSPSGCVGGSPILSQACVYVPPAPSPAPTGGGSEVVNGGGGGGGSLTGGTNYGIISASAGANGSISPSGSITVANGSNKTFLITPNVGYKVDSLLVDGKIIGPSTTYAFIGVTGNHKILATFTPLSASQSTNQSDIIKFVEQSLNQITQAIPKNTPSFAQPATKPPANLQPVKPPSVQLPATAVPKNKNTVIQILSKMIGILQSLLSLAVK